MLQIAKAISLNIGSNSRYINGRGQIDPVDLTFQYLPIPETKPVVLKVPTYAELQVKKKQLKDPNQLVHFDPEFRTCTYGHIKRGYGDINALLSLNEGDYLFFHATLSHPNKPSLWLTAIIGYFIIESVHDCRGLAKEEIQEQYGDRFKSNAHLKRVDPSVDLLISGSKKSKLFGHAIPLSNFSVPLRLNNRFKSIITTVSGKQIDDGKPWYRWTLKVNAPEEIIELGKGRIENLHIYTMTSDSGFAPHLKDGWISLACCAGPTREHTKIGNFVLGLSGKGMNNVPPHTLIYLMQVDEKLTFDEYYCDQRFVGRVDNIYEKKEGKYTLNRRNVKDKRYINMHEGGDDTEKSEFILLSRHFYYFGDYWKRDKKLHRKMEDFCGDIGYKYTVGGNYKKLSTGNENVKKLMKFVIETYKVGKIGRPNSLPKIDD